MKEQELVSYLKQNFPQENEKCEWKEFKNLKHAISSKEGDDIISYVSAIANMKGGRLVIGVKDKTLDVVGIQNFHSYNIQNIKLKIITDCPNLSSENFEIQEFKSSDTNKTVWIFHIPKHPYRLPVYAHKKCWQRINDSLIALTQSRLDSILTEIKPSEDWSAAIVEGAAIDDLDEIAIKKARIEFTKRNPKYKEDEPVWSDVKFLDKAKLTIKGKITRTALILLGKEEAEHYLGSFVKIRWNLKTLDNQDKDFEIFSIPFIRAVDEVYHKIRNLKYRYLRDGTLFPDEVLRYDPFTIRESLNNAIAHQDYTKAARINVTEFEDDRLVFSNYGSFLPKSIEDVVLKDTPEEVYRNPFLAEAMKNLDMIETQGGGIRKIFNLQRQRFFPMPDYDLSDGKFRATITGKILNEDFARILIKNPELSLEDILLLDKVQKGNPINDNSFAYLKKRKFVKGRRPNIFLSANVIQTAEDETLIAEYIRNKEFDDDYYQKMILDYLRKWKEASRKQIENLLWDKFPDALDEKARFVKITNLLQTLRKAELITLNKGKKWIMGTNGTNGN